MSLLHWIRPSIMRNYPKWMQRHVSRSLFSSDNRSDSNLTEEIKTLTTNPYFEKYSEKIIATQKISPEEFKAKLENKKKIRGQGKEKVPQEKIEFKLGSPKPDITWTSNTKKTLDSVLKLELIEDKNADQISDIWRDYHKQQDKICAVIPANTYRIINERAEKFPIFLYPIPRSQGYEFVMAQFNGNECHFTTLINYQAHKENAPECLAVTHYPELMDNKGIVLMNGEFDKNILSASEAQCLINQLQLYYADQDTGSKYQLLKKFTQSPDSFKHMDLIQELQNLTINL